MYQMPKVEVEVACTTRWLPVGDTTPPESHVLKAFLDALPVFCVTILNEAKLSGVRLRSAHVSVVPVPVHAWATGTPTLAITLRVRIGRPDANRDSFILTGLAKLFFLFFENMSTKPTITLTLLPLEGTTICLETRSNAQYHELQQ